MRFGVALLAATAAVAAAAPAKAGLFTVKVNPADQNFTQCDGYAAPGKKSDGITVGTWMFGLATSSVDERRSKTALGQAGLTACGAALADPRVQPFVTRRGHLWQSKAIHQIALGKFDDAMASLDKSDQEGRAEPYFDQSIGQGNRALRAAALHGKGKRPEAEAILDELERRRPYAVSQRQLAMRMRLQFEDDRARQWTIMERLSAVLPSVSHQLFWQSMIYGEFDQALRHAANVRHDDPKRRGGWKSDNEFAETYLDVVERSDFAGAKAYALFVTDQVEPSAATLKQAEADVRSTMQPPPPPEPGQKLSRKTVEDFELRKAAGKKALSQLEMWRANIRLRSNAPKLTPDEIKKAIDQSGQKMPMIADIVGHARADTLEESRVLGEITKALAVLHDETRLKGTRMGFNDLVALLPRPETARTQLRFKREEGILGSGLEGYAVKRNQPAGATTVRYGTAAGSLALVDEGVLLAAARYAADEGKDAFLIDARQPIQRTTNVTTCYYACGPAVPTNSGYEVQLVVRAVASASVSDSERQRLIRTADVISALTPRLIPATGGGQ